MPTVDLSTTNLFLGIMAAVSVVQGLLLIGAGVAGFLFYKRVIQLVTDLEARQVAPIRAKVEEILGDVKTVTARVSEQTERVDSAISGTMDRVDETAERVRHSVMDKVSQATGVVRGIRAVVASVLTNISPGGNGARSSADAAGRL